TSGPSAHPSHPSTETSLTDADDGSPSPGDDGASRFWRAFDALDGQDQACTEFLWARTLQVMLRRITPNDDPRYVDVAWDEGVRVAALVGLDAQTFLDQATAALPDPKSWAKEASEAMATERASAPGSGIAASDRPAPPPTEPTAKLPALGRRRARRHRTAVQPAPSVAAAPAGAA
ncbi:MAG TPA: hypothetical protein VMW75_08815, partial [Thermoanaerobaculia bacterium]|nr:hypothetical protein [Thermoanaerobaculia bacterium]